MAPSGEVWPAFYKPAQGPIPSAWRWRWDEIGRSGALDAAVGQARALADEACGLLDHLPDNDCRSAISDLAEFVVDRVPLTAGGLDPPQIRAMFDAIAPTYDRINRMISMGLDNGWRRRVIDVALADRPKILLDIGTGTGDLVALARRRGSDRLLAIGVDFSQAMLLAGRPRVLRAGGHLARADALRLPIGDGAVDAIVCAFVVRNLSDRKAAFFRVAPGAGERRAVGDPGNDADGQRPAGAIVQVLLRRTGAAAGPVSQRPPFSPTAISRRRWNGFPGPAELAQETCSGRIRAGQLGAVRIRQRSDSCGHRSRGASMSVAVCAVERQRVWAQLFRAGRPTKQLPATLGVG